MNNWNEFASLKFIFGVFYCTFWFYKGNPPFNIWWLIGITILEIILATILLKITKITLTK